MNVLNFTRLLEISFKINKNTRINKEVLFSALGYAGYVPLSGDESST